MKVIITAIITTITWSGYAQNLINESSIWRERSFHAGFDGTYSISTSDIFFARDTIVEGKTYFIPQKSGIVTVREFGSNEIVEQYSFFQTLNPIREEAGVFYRYSDNVSQEFIFQDFNLSLGDTAFSDCQSAQVVEHIDTVYVGSEPRRRFYFEDNSIDYLIEGVGSSRGLFHQPCSELFFEAAYHLQCYSQDGYFLRIDIDSSESCETVLRGSVINNSHLIQIIPNPFNTYVEVQFDEALNYPVKIALLNVYGQNLRSQIMASGSSNVFLFTQDIPPGVYVLRLEFEKFNATYQLIKP